MSDQLPRIGVVGAGYWGANLVRNCAELGVLDAVCDANEKTLAAVKDRYPSIATTASFSELLDRPIEGVVIAAPAKLHAELALEALASGKHVFVEKPLALSVADGIAVQQAASAAGRLVFVGHVLLYHPAVKRMRSLIAEGIIGNVWHVRARRLNLGKIRTDENVWWSFAPHDLALALTVFDAEPETAQSRQAYGRGVNVADAAYAFFEFPNGRSAHIEVSWLDPERSARLDVFGTHGALTLDDSRRDSVLTLRPFKLSKDGDGMPVTTRGEEKVIPVERIEPLKAELQAFLDSMTTGREPETDVVHGIKVLRALKMAEEAAHAEARHRVLS